MLQLYYECFFFPLPTTVHFLFQKPLETPMLTLCCSLALSLTHSHANLCVCFFLAFLLLFAMAGDLCENLPDFPALATNGGEWR